MHREIPADSDLLNAFLEQLRGIVQRTLRGCPVAVYLFGSSVRGVFRRTSDIDLGVLSHGPLPPGLLAELRDRIEESSIPRRVEVVSLDEADPSFRRRVIREGVPWIV
jgi:predicted nucleotidyltransferase